MPISLSPSGRRESSSSCSAEEHGVLVVDDRADNLLALERVLQPLGRRILRATSADQVLGLVVREPVAAVVMDVLTPRINGLELLAKLSQLDQTRHLPVIFLRDGSREDRMAARAYNLGAAGFLTRPVDPWALRAQVRALADLYVLHRLVAPTS